MGVPWTAEDEKRTIDLIVQRTSGKRCALCQKTDVRLSCRGHCHHCYRLIRKVEKLEEKARDLTGLTPGEKWELLRFDLPIARKAVDLARLEGQVFVNIAQKTVQGLDIEQQLSRISRRLIHRDLYCGHANIIDWHFTPAQKKLLYYLLSQLDRAYIRQNRLKRAIAGYHRDQIAKHDKANRHQTR